jgi:hypothetical protein
MKFQYGWAFPDADRFMLEEISKHGEYQRTHLEAALKFVTDSLGGDRRRRAYRHVLEGDERACSSAWSRPSPAWTRSRRCPWNLRDVRLRPTSRPAMWRSATKPGHGRDAAWSPEQALKANTGAQVRGEGRNDSRRDDRQLEPADAGAAEARRRRLRADGAARCASRPSNGAGRSSCTRTSSCGRGTTTCRSGPSRTCSSRSAIWEDRTGVARFHLEPEA